MIWKETVGGWTEAISRRGFEPGTARIQVILVIAWSKQQENDDTFKTEQQSVVRLLWRIGIPKDSCPDTTAHTHTDTSTLI